MVSAQNGSNKNRSVFFRRIVRVLLSAAVMLLAAVALLIVLETALRAAGYGTSTHFLVRRTIAGKDYFLPNREYLRQFFSMPMDSIVPWDQYEFQAPAVKDPDAFRIFVFGGSAANGAPPDCAYAFWRMLDAMLCANFPGVRFEVYNAAVSGMNSNVMYPAAKACAALQPDVFVIYMGNNEICGPFGAQSWLTHPYTSSLAVIRAKTWASGLRLVQLAGGASLFRQKSAVLNLNDLGSWYCSIQPASSHAQTVYRHYKRNLEDMCKAAFSVKAATIACTVASNLLFWEPSQSDNDPPLSTEDKDAYHSYYNQALERDDAGMFGEAAALYEKALALSDTSANLCHRLGYCYFMTGRCEEAYRLLRRARDLDWCIVRANVFVNDAVKAVAAAWEGKGVYLVDAERDIAEGCPCGVPGVDRFYDAVHLNPDGHYRLARSVFEKILKVLPARFPNLDISAAKPLSQSECEERIGMSPWVKHSHTVNTYAMQPEGLTRTTVRRNQALKERSEALAQLVGPDGTGDALTAFASAISRRPNDNYLRYRRIQLLLSKGDSMGALKDVEEALNVLGPRRYLKGLQAHLLMGIGKKDEARRALEDFLKWYPDDPEGTLAYAGLLEADGRLDEALAANRRAYSLNPALDMALENEGNILKRQGRMKQALEAFRKALYAQPMTLERYLTLHAFLEETFPGDTAEQIWRAMAERFLRLPLPRLYLAAALEKRGAAQEAGVLYREAEQLAPASPEVHAALAQIREGQGRFQDALAAAQKTLELAPADFMSYERFDTLLIRHFSPQERVAQWQAVVQAHPDSARAHVKLGAAFEAVQDRTEAARAYSRSLELNPYDRDATERLERLKRPAATNE